MIATNQFRWFRRTFQSQDGLQTVGGSLVLQQFNQADPLVKGEVDQWLDIPIVEEVVTTSQEELKYLACDASSQTTVALPPELIEAPSKLL